MRRPIIMGAIVATIAPFVLAPVVALVFRFPVPFAGYSSGTKAIIPSLFAVLMYEVVLGGFVILPGLGAIAGVLASRVGGPDKKSMSVWTFVFALVPALVAVILLSVWDRIYGPW